MVFFNESNETFSQPGTHLSSGWWTNHWENLVVFCFNDTNGRLFPKMLTNLLEVWVIGFPPNMDVNFSKKFAWRAKENEFWVLSYKWNVYVFLKVAWYGLCQILALNFGTTFMGQKKGTIAHYSWRIVWRTNFVAHFWNTIHGQRSPL